MSGPAVGLALVALSTSLGWAIRGAWGHWWGETVVGALCGMSLWLSFGETGNAWQMLAFAATISLSHAVGGEISYGRIVAYVLRTSQPEESNAPMRSQRFGLFAIFLVGGMIGFYPATAFGLLISTMPYGIGDLALWAVVASIGAFLSYKFLVLGMGLRLSPPRSDYWAATLGGCLATTAYFGAIAKDAVVVRTGFLGWLGYGGGFVIGVLLHRTAARARWRVDSWKWMEHSVGFFGGLSLGLSGMFADPALGEIQLPGSARLASAAVVFWFVPYLVLTNNFEYWTFERGFISRRIFAAFHVVSLLTLAVFLAAVRGTINSLLGESWQRSLYILAIWLYTSVAILKHSVGPGPGSARLFLAAWPGRYREYDIVRATFVAMGAACTVLAMLR